MEARELGSESAAAVTPSNMRDKSDHIEDMEAMNIQENVGDGGGMGGELEGRTGPAETRYEAERRGKKYLG